MGTDPGNEYRSAAIRKLPSSFNEYRTGWISPSNIALVKYWGKKQGQIPRNPSVSITLASSVTEMTVTAGRKQSAGSSTEFLFEGKREPSFESRIARYLQNTESFFPYLRDLALKIESRNTFPHSAGIASSASSMSALALCLCSLERHLSGAEDEEAFLRKASYMARLGSGSACRSVYGGFTSWGRADGIPGSSDTYASPLKLTGQAFDRLCDAILIVDSKPKKLSSSAGHLLMNRHPCAASRYRQARKHIGDMVLALGQGDRDLFTRVVENEAMSLHGLLQGADPPVILLEGNSLEILHRVRAFREETGIFVTFTLDAGPNVHLIYPEQERQRIIPFIQDTLAGYCEEGLWIDDRMGGGPEEFIHS